MRSPLDDLTVNTIARQLAAAELSEAADPLTWSGSRYPGAYGGAWGRPGRLPVSVAPRRALAVALHPARPGALAAVAGNAAACSPAVSLDRIAAGSAADGFRQARQLPRLRPLASLEAPLLAMDPPAVGAAGRRRAGPDGCLEATLAAGACELPDASAVRGSHTTHPKSQPRIATTSAISSASSSRNPIRQRE